jgi:hypothetical protein
MKAMRRWLLVLAFAAAVASAAAEPGVRLELIPPSPVTDKITLDIRGAVTNDSEQACSFQLRLYLDAKSRSSMVREETVSIGAHESAGIYYRRATAGWTGTHQIILSASCAGRRFEADRPIQVIPSAARSTRTISGAWVGIVHWSDEEGIRWNADIRKLSDEDWRQQIDGMHSLGMNTVVVQQVFQNQEYYGRHNIPADGYKGQAYYPSRLFPARAAIAAHDPLEAILSEADRLNMNVFLGVGMYAWFDFSPASLEWHKQVAAELWRRYGHHPSFYGWYVSEEVYGNLIPDPGDSQKARYRQEIIAFFTAFQAWCRSLAPEKPVMLAPNAHGLMESKDVWPLVLKHLDIVCPFGFDRMPPGDITGQEAANLWQRMANQAGAHLWLDLEAFSFEGKALVPGDMANIGRDLRRFSNSPASRLKPGGPPTVTLYSAYRQYLRGMKR